MPKTLYLLRHAKSSWRDDSLDDFERPLAPRGRQAAPAMARHMADRGWLPDRVLCSAAVRTRETWELARPILGDPPALVLDALYGASAGRILELVRAHGGDADRLLVIGHNPGMGALASLLAGGGGSGEEMARLREKFPTAGLAVLRFDVDGWSGVGPGEGDLLTFLRPKDL